MLRHPSRKGCQPDQWLLTNAESLRQREELAEVKAERARLLGSLAKLKKETAKAGAELQQQVWCRGFCGTCRQRGQGATSVCSAMTQL